MRPLAPSPSSSAVDASPADARGSVPLDGGAQLCGVRLAYIGVVAVLLTVAAMVSRTSAVKEGGASAAAAAAAPPRQSMRAPPGLPAFDTFYINTAAPDAASGVGPATEAWKAVQATWGPLFRPATRLRALDAPPSPASFDDTQHLATAIARAIDTMQTNAHPWVVIITPGAVPTAAATLPAWEALLHELAARIGDWDVVQMGGQLLSDDALAITPVACSTAFLSVNASMGGKLLVLSRSLLTKAGEWLASARTSFDPSLMSSEQYFTYSGPAAQAGFRKHGNSARYAHPDFSIWWPRESMTGVVSRIHGLAEGFAASARVIAAAGDAAYGPQGEGGAGGAAAAVVMEGCPGHAQSS